MLETDITKNKQNTRPFNPKTVKIGNQVWMSENLTVDDGGEGIHYNPNNGQYYYTWDAAVRVAQSIPGWRLPSVDDWNEVCMAYNGKPVEGTGYVKGARELYDKLQILPTGYYCGSVYSYISGAYFWTITEISSYYAYFWSFHTGAAMYRDVNDKDFGDSVRLVKE